MLFISRWCGVRMKFYQGRKLRSQPHNLNYVLYIDMYDYDVWRVFRGKMNEIVDWCNETYGKILDEDKYFGTGYPEKYLTYNWRLLYGTRYAYFMFKTKEDALKFKLVWA